MTWHRWGDAWVDPRPLALARIAIGAVMAISMLRMLLLGWPDQFYHQPIYHFQYYGFGWITPPGHGWLEATIVIAALAGCAVACGVWTRRCAGTFAILFTWIELCDQSTYLNHYYLVSLLAVLLAWLPSAATWSVDARLRSRSGREPMRVYARHLYLLRAQIVVVYSCAGLAKIHADWLIDGMPLHVWLARFGDAPLIGGLLEARATAVAASWCGMLYDLLIPWLLLWRRTHSVAMVGVVTFHIITWLLFPIGMFPWIMIASSLVFWPTDNEQWQNKHLHRPPVSPQWHYRAGTVVTVTWLVVQMLWPWRYLLHVGDALARAGISIWLARDGDGESGAGAVSRHRARYRPHSLC